MKKLLSLVIASLMLLSTGCSDNSDENSGSSGSDTINLKVWTSQEDQQIVKDMVNKFTAEKADKNYKIDYGVVSEADAKNEILKDVGAAADVFTFSSDQLSELHSAGSLYRITKNKEDIIKNNTEASISASKIGDELYAFPSSSDTYFMYYDKSKYSEEDVKSLETMLSKDLGENVNNFAFDINNGWYLSGFFFANGCTLFGPNGTDPASMDFNEPKGVEVGNYLIDLVKNPKFMDFQDDGQLLTTISNGQCAAAVTGTWNATTIQGYLGENFAAAKLPTINIGGEDKQLSSMSNYKLYGVNAQTKYPAEALELAEYLTNKQAQQIRFEKRSYAPTNTELINDKETMSSNIAISALADQAQYSILQTSIPQITKYWSPAEAFGLGILDGSVTKENMQEKLDALVSSTLSSLS